MAAPLLYLFPTSAAAVRGISTFLKPRNPHPKKLDIVVPLQQLDEVMGLCSFQVKHDADVNVPKISSTPVMTLAPPVSADIWHGRVGHRNPRSMELLRKNDGNGVDYTGIISSCDVCALGHN